LFAESSGLEKLVEDNPASNFFIDEAPVSEKSFPAESLARMAKKLSTNNYLWIACQSDKVPHKQDSNFEGYNFWLNYNSLNNCKVFSIFSVLVAVLLWLHCPSCGSTS
jgi:hypothetical protein